MREKELLRSQMEEGSPAVQTERKYDIDYGMWNQTAKKGTAGCVSSGKPQGRVISSSGYADV